MEGCGRAQSNGRESSCLLEAVPRMEAEFSQRSSDCVITLLTSWHIYNVGCVLVVESQKYA